VSRGPDLDDLAVEDLDRPMTAGFWSARCRSFRSASPVSVVFAAVAASPSASPFGSTLSISIRIGCPKKLAQAASRDSRRSRSRSAAKGSGVKIRSF